MAYDEIKLLHTIFAILSVSGFILRGYWMLRDSQLLEHRVTKTLPHFIDTLFLTTGLLMLYLLSTNPASEVWLIAKFLGLIAYIVTGVFALRPDKTKTLRFRSLVLAILIYLYLFGVAINKSPISWLAVFI